jgi:hypothetical protein
VISSDFYYIQEIRYSLLFFLSNLQNLYTNLPGSVLAKTKAHRLSGAPDLIEFWYSRLSCRVFRESLQRRPAEKTSAAIYRQLFRTEGLPSGRLANPADVQNSRPPDPAASVHQESLLNEASLTRRIGPRIAAITILARSSIMNGVTPSASAAEKVIFAMIASHAVPSR